MRCFSLIKRSVDSNIVIISQEGLRFVKKRVKNRQWNMPPNNGKGARGKDKPKKPFEGRSRATQRGASVACEA
jgi:hypothetical protein